MDSVDSYRLRPRRPNAFTLIEMLIVIAIMAILMTAGAVGLSGMGGKNVTSAVVSAEAMFDEARTLAKGKNLRSCVLVAKNLTNSPTDNLRKILIATEEADANGIAVAPNNATPQWVIQSRGIVLPDQVYFSQVYSQEQGAGGSKSDIESITASNLKTPKTAQAGEYFIYKFNAQGIRIPKSTSTGSVVYPTSFVVGAGSRNPSQATAKPKVSGSERRDFGGFVVWRGGNTSLYRSPTQISPDLKNLSAGAEF